MRPTLKHTQGIVLSLQAVCLCLVQCYNVSIRMYNKTPNSHQLVQQTFYALPPNEANGYQSTQVFVTRQENQDKRTGRGKSVLNVRYEPISGRRPKNDSSQDIPFSYQSLRQDQDAGHVSTNIVQANYKDFGDAHSYKTTLGLGAHATEKDNLQWICLAFGICSSLHGIGAQNPKPPLVTLFEWKQLEFDYDNENARQNDIDSGFYQPNMAAPIDSDVFYRDPPKENKVFVSIPRFQIGSPATVATITKRMYKGNPVLKPYPDWSWHRNPTQCKSNRLVSVYRMKIDECGRLWLLDTGRYGDHQTCPPQIIAFDLQTNHVIHKFEIPASLLEPRSILVTLQVDNRDSHCRSPFIYVADCQTYSIIVHDVRKGTAWKATDKTMYPFPDYGTYNIQGDQFDLMDGVLGMDLEPYVSGKDRKLFYHAMSSGTENWVYTSNLRNESLFQVDPTAHPNIFNTYNSKRPSQSCAMALDRDGIAYFGLMSETSVNCWHTANHDYGKHIETVYRNPVTMQFASGVKVITNLKRQQELWVLTSRFQKVATDSVNISEVNFRISAGRISELLQRTRCKHNHSNTSPTHGGPTGGYGLLSPNH